MANVAFPLQPEAHGHRPGLPQPSLHPDRRPGPAPGAGSHRGLRVPLLPRRKTPSRPGYPGGPHLPGQPGRIRRHQADRDHQGLRPRGSHPPDGHEQRLRRRLRPRGPATSSHHRPHPARPRGPRSRRRGLQRQQLPAANKATLGHHPVVRLHQQRPRGRHPGRPRSA